MDVHSAGLAHALVAPGLPQQLLPADGGVGLIHQGQQKGHFLGGQLDPAAVEQGHLRCFVHGDLPGGRFAA